MLTPPLCTIFIRNYNCCLYKFRQLVENIFFKLKQSRSIVTRHAKHANSLLTAVQKRDIVIGPKFIGSIIGMPVCSLDDIVIKPALPYGRRRCGPMITGYSGIRKSPSLIQPQRRSTEAKIHASRPGSKKWNTATSIHTSVPVPMAANVLI